MISVKFSDNTTLEIGNKVLDRLVCINQRGFKIESGGILLGKKSIISQEYYLDEVTLPSKRDRKGLFYFVRNAESANIKIQKAWKKSSGIVNYLGEWHTHNEPRPCPSPIDKDLIRQIVLDKSYPLDRVFMLIMGNDFHMFCGVVNPELSPQFYDTKMIGWKNEELLY